MQSYSVKDRMKYVVALDEHPKENTCFSLVEQKVFKFIHKCLTMAAFLPDTDSEDELPPGWEERATLDGKVYYANHVTKSTQWSHPRTGKKKKVTGELPHGWEKKVTDDGNVFYVDHINHKTTYTDPRLAFAVEEKEFPTDIRQRFDASTHALQILHGRDLGGKVAVITGSNCGIGYETARALAYHGCEIYFACRNRESTMEAMERICKERPNSIVHYIHLDLASFKSIEEFCIKFEREKKNINMLILNAGTFGLPFSHTEDGFEATFQVNHLGHFYLVKLLTPLLLKSAPCRVVVLSSESHRQSFITAQNISEERLSPKTANGFYSIIAYNDSKLCNLLFSNELNRRLSTFKIFSNAVHPGNLVSSYLSRNWWLYRLLFAFVRPFTKSLIKSPLMTQFASEEPIGCYKLELIITDVHLGRLDICCGPPTCKRRFQDGIWKGASSILLEDSCKK
ncbi:WW domain-containing oxidoreductase [Trichonephila inaurata madagascariensis]|uniref:WW domain-containing oxidoreductase n=1 Tax=Trichonephila inaurata madagascariensis TaxID=2747483 RepID=A0A8X6YID6_9ARAC|nr:WW domain-containing oxidoreductase [Trichonephila inaurata madagascariensis]